MTALNDNEQRMWCTEYFRFDPSRIFALGANSLIFPLNFQWVFCKLNCTWITGIIWMKLKYTKPVARVGRWKMQTKLCSWFNYQLNAQFLYFILIHILHYNPRHVSSNTMLILRRSNCVVTASGIVTLCKRLYSAPVESGLRGVHSL